MGIKNVKVSDISGVDLKEDEAIRVVVRNHPKLDEPKQIDAAGDEIKSLKGLTNLVTVNVVHPSGIVDELAVTVTELEKVIPLHVLQEADGIRGRRKGYRPGQ